MAKERKEDTFVKKPIYLGGNKAFREFIYSNLKYPKKALEAKVEGIVLVRYSINYKGKVVDAKVKKGIGHGCDKEALRIVKLLEFQIPKGPRKLKVLFHKETKIKFKLPVSKKKTAPSNKPVTAEKTKVQYNFIPKKKNNQKKEEKTKPSYGYTIYW